MSTDWEVVCDNCRERTHLGQRFSSGPCFGHGSKDDSGRKKAAEFIEKHWGCQSTGLRILDLDVVPSDYKDRNDPD